MKRWYTPREELLGHRPPPCAAAKGRGLPDVKSPRCRFASPSRHGDAAHVRRAPRRFPRAGNLGGRADSPVVLGVQKFALLLSWLYSNDVLRFGSGRGAKSVGNHRRKHLVDTWKHK